MLTPAGAGDHAGDEECAQEEATPTPAPVSSHSLHSFQVPHPSSAGANLCRHLPVSQRGVVSVRTFYQDHYNVTREHTQHQAAQLGGILCSFGTQLMVETNNSKYNVIYTSIQSKTLSNMWMGYFSIC